MTDARRRYEQLRPLIIWPGLTELAWIVYWLVSGGNKSATFIGIVAAWTVIMLAWLALVSCAGKREFFLKQSERLSNLVGVAIVVTFAVAAFGLIPAARDGLVSQLYTSLANASG